MNGQFRQSTSPIKMMTGGLRKISFSLSEIWTLEPCIVEEGVGAGHCKLEP